MPTARYLAALVGIFIQTIGGALGSSAVSRLGRGIAAAVAPAKNI